MTKNTPPDSEPDLPTEAVPTLLNAGNAVAEHLSRALMKTRTGNSSLRPTFTPEHPPCVPDEIADRTPVATTRHHVVLPQGKSWDDTRPHAVWYAYDERVEAFKHPLAPDDSDWWFIMVKPFDGKKWTHKTQVCAAPNAATTGDLIAAYLNGEETAIATARTDIPASIQNGTRTRSTGPKADDSPSESAQRTLDTVSD